MEFFRVFHVLECTQRLINNLIFCNIFIFKRGSPVAFVEFFEVGQAVHVMHALQGFGLSANNGVGTGIRIEFAKTRMGDTFLSKQDGMRGRGDR